MALADREYMRDDEPPLWRGAPLPGWRWSATIVLMVAIGAAFLLQNTLTVPPKFPNLALIPNEFWHGAVWQLLTFQFLHGGLLHVAANLFSLWSFGRVLEQRLGRGKFLALYFASGVAGGLLQATLGALAPAQFGGTHLLGASAGICGVFAAFAMFEPEAVVLFFFLPMRARTMYLSAVILSAVLAIFMRDSSTAHAAHLGGLLAGAALIRLRFFHRRRPSFTKGFTDARQWLTKLEPKKPAKPEEFISREVDPILDKISAHGLQSLTDTERKTLETARQQMERR
ncbi:MAG: Rhomboid protease GlpG [Verrucomicrobiota bacterium]|jgi:membrane associated rhomboid family serine protease